MVRICVLGDPHFKKNNLDVMKNACNEILNIIKERKPDLTICLGDTLDTHERLYLRALTQATNFFLDIAKMTPLVVIIGNHDRENNSDFQTNIHPFTGLTWHPDITIVDKTQWDTDKNFIYVPYVPPGRFREALMTANYDPNNNDLGPRLIFCHQEFSGCRMGSIISTKGDTWSEQLPWIISGHIHEHQELRKIVYVGTFVQQNYGEGDDKAIMMLEVDEEQQNKPLIERIHLTSVPKMVTIHLNADELANFSDKLPPDMIPKNNRNENTQGSLVRVIIHIDATDTKSLKYNPQYRALEDSVDKVDIRTISNRASVANTMIRQFQEIGTLDNKTTYSLEEVVRAMLKDDPVSLKFFETEILTS